MKKPFLFISYRREDEGPTAIFIKSKLDEVFGNEHVFMDLDNIQRGDNWKDTLKSNLEECDCLIVIIGKNWRGGVIRWLKQSSEKSLELGLEVLAQEIFPCAVRVQADRHISNYHPALILKNQNLDETKTTLILPGSQIFREQQAVHLRLGKEEVKVYLLTAQLITQSFVQFDFELLNEEEQPVLHKFIAQKNMDTNDQDLWEALK